MTLQSIVGLAGSALLASAALGLVLRRAPLCPARRAVLLVLAFAAAWVPAGGLPLAAYLRGVIGDLSVPTLFLAAASLATTLLRRPLLGERETAAGSAAVLAAALFLYPMALGLGAFDPYALGYGSWGFAAALALVVIAAWAARLERLAWVLLAAIAAWLAGLLDSANLWDYLIDPLLAAWALGKWGQITLSRSAARKM